MWEPVSKVLFPKPEHRMLIMRNGRSEAFNRPELAFVPFSRILWGFKELDDGEKGPEETLFVRYWSPEKSDIDSVYSESYQPVRDDSELQFLRDLGFRVWEQIPKPAKASSRLCKTKGWIMINRLRQVNFIRSCPLKIVRYPGVMREVMLMGEKKLYPKDPDLLMWYNGEWINTRFGQPIPDPEDADNYRRALDAIGDLIAEEEKCPESES